MFAAAAEFLRAYEKVNGLTFVALDDRTLHMLPQDTAFTITDATAQENPKIPHGTIVSLTFIARSGPLAGERFIAHVNPLRLHSKAAIREVCDLADITVIGDDE